LSKIPIRIKLARNFFIGCPKQAATQLIPVKKHDENLFKRIFKCFQKPGQVSKDLWGVYPEVG
jgi:hypothetical protein